MTETDQGRYLIKMGVIENYKEFFKNPRDWAMEVLDEGWELWVYALIMLGVSILMAAPMVILAYVSKIAAILLTLFQIAWPFIAVLILNAPFKKPQMTWVEVYKVNLAFWIHTFPVSAIGLVIYGLALLVAMYLPALGIILFILTFIGLMALFIWMMINYFRALSELHDTSPWKIFLMAVAIGIALQIIFYAVTFAWLASIFK